ncbi:MFS general substrate transporter [Corynespora cassiicola Philippines]|uniref:MFS general substrate transporter n=1 Tax=Corynespora cassiicola Philippines TaxID=1448308 RepID=A0A2T2N0G0_CORCC|nr:MFS general substrate transporter [Corynespora cassiicola Philippines]
MCLDAGKPERKQWLVMISLGFISFIVSLDATILVTVLPVSHFHDRCHPELARFLRSSTAETFWIGTSYLLTSAVVQPVVAAASNGFGRPQLLIVSIVLFAFGTAFCAVAHDVTVMLVGRCAQGVGGGGIITMTQLIFCDMVPLRQRPKYFAIVLASWSVGTIAGPVVGGCLVEKASWRWCFHINFPFCGTGLAAAYLFVRPGDAAGLPLSGASTQMDWIGGFLFVSAVTSFLAAVDLFPAVCLFVPGSVLVAVLTSRLGRFRWALWAGWGITTAACGLFLLFGLDTKKPVFAVALALFGVGNGMVLTGVNVATQAISRVEDRAMAACMYGFMRSLGMPIGVAVSGAIFQTAMSHALSESSLPTGIAHDSERYVSVLWAMAESDPTKAAVLQSYAAAFHAVFTALTAMSASAWLASFLIKKSSMDVATPTTR